MQIEKDVPFDLVIQCLDGLSDKYSSPKIVVELTNPNVTDYERGLVRGKIEMLEEIKRELYPKSVEVKKDEEENIK